MASCSLFSFTILILSFCIGLSTRGLKKRRKLYLEWDPVLSPPQQAALKKQPHKVWLLTQGSYHFISCSWALCAFF